jgi:hypothetical protein
MVQSHLDWQAISSQTQGLGSTTGHFMVQTAASLCLKRHFRFHDDAGRSALRANRFREGVDKGAVHRLWSGERGRGDFWIAGSIQAPDAFYVEIRRRVRQYKPSVPEAAGHFADGHVPLLLCRLTE